MQEEKERGYYLHHLLARASRKLSRIVDLGSNRGMTNLSPLWQPTLLPSEEDGMSSDMQPTNNTVKKSTSHDCNICTIFTKSAHQCAIQETERTSQLPTSLFLIICPKKKKKD